MSFLRTIRQTSVAASVAALTIVGAAAVASADPAPTAGVYTGNRCLDSDGAVSNAGAEACVFVNTRSSSWLGLSAGAFDYARDGYSAKTDVVMQQLVNGAWLDTGTIPSVIDSSGYNTSRVGGRYTYGRRSGAIKWRLRIQACTYDSPTKVHRSCGSQYTASHAW